VITKADDRKVRAVTDEQSSDPSKKKADAGLGCKERFEMSTVGL
jgi:hypothetical protein